MEQQQYQPPRPEQQQYQPPRPEQQQYQPPRPEQQQYQPPRLEQQQYQLPRSEQQQYQPPIMEQPQREQSQREQQYQLVGTHPPKTEQLVYNSHIVEQKYQQPRIEKEPLQLKYENIQSTENYISGVNNQIIPTNPNILNIEEKKVELLEINNQILKRQNALEENIILLKKREQAILELEDKYKTYTNLFQNINQKNFIHLLIDTKLLGTTGMNNYIYNLNSSLVNVNQINILNVSVPTNYYNVVKNTELVFNIDDVEYKVEISKGFYTVNSILNIVNKDNEHFELKLNEVEGILYIESTQKVTLIINELFNKLGFEEQEVLTAIKKPDLRVDKYLHLFILNLDEKEPLCIVNPDNFTPTIINIKNPIALDKLAICFKTRDGEIYDLSKSDHLIEFRIHYMNPN
jgi:hypothetical protein